MGRRVPWIVVALLLAAVATLFVACKKSKANIGPNGGDVVSVPNTGARAEVVGNPETGEVVVRTWDRNLDKPEPLPRDPLVLGDGERRLELMPHAMADDPEGRSSRFYGQAEWLRGGKVERGWLECCGGARGREEFAWSSGWAAGRRHDDMWREMRGHGGMQGHGMGMPGGLGRQGEPSPQTQPMPEHSDMKQAEEQRGMGHMSGGPMGAPPTEPSPAPTPQEQGDR